MKSVTLSTQSLTLTVGKSSSGRQNEKQRTLCDALDFELRSGELVALLGRNGSGKTTLLKALAGIRSPESGEIFFGDSFGLKNSIAVSTRRRATLLALALSARQSDGTLSGEEFVALGRWPHTPWHGKLSANDQSIIHRALEITGTRSFAALSMSQLSDGERQKLALARALAQETPVLLLDEPLSHLDAPSRLYEIALLKRLAENEDKAILFSCHDLDLAFHSAHRLLVLLPDGKWFCGLPAEVAAHEACREVLGLAAAPWFLSGWGGTP